MKITGVICEFNPFHNGHEYLLKKIKEDGASHIAVCMSGNFTQRGEPAVYNKYDRCRAALQCGADLVIELPVTFALSGAERFAWGGVSLLDSLGCIDELFFGSESGDTALLSRAAAAADAPELSELIVKNLSGGMTFAAARQAAVAELCGEGLSAVLSQPNNILGVEYIRALNRLGSSIKPVSVLRMGVSHDSGDVSGNFASASYIRGMIGKDQDISKFVPEKAYDIFSGTDDPPPPGGRKEKLIPMLLYRLRMMSAEETAGLPEISEGLENRIYSAVRKAVGYEELVGLIKSKRYTRARIERILMYALLGFRKESLPEKPGYIRVLGFNERGREILRLAGKNNRLPIIMKYSDIKKHSRMIHEEYETECRADDIYALTGKNIHPCGINMTRGLLRPNIPDSQSLLN